VSEAVNRALMRLASNIGAPYGRDEFQMKQMADDWIGVLSGFGPTRIEQAVSEWLRSQTKWPAPAAIRQLCLDHTTTDTRRQYQAEKPLRKDEGSLAGVAEISRIRKKHAGSDTPYTDTLNDPEYQAYLADYTRRTGRQPA
jgi:hypothetical protein